MRYKNKPRKGFKSGLEITASELLKAAGIPFEYEPWKIVLVKPFKWETSYEETGKKEKKKFGIVKTVRAVTYKPDFVGKNWVMETKGIKTQDFIIRWKLFKQYITDNNLDYTLFMPTNKKQILESIRIIKELEDGKAENEQKQINEGNPKGTVKSTSCKKRRNV